MKPIRNIGILLSIIGFVLMIIVQHLPIVKMLKPYDLGASTVIIPTLLHLVCLLIMYMGVCVMRFYHLHKNDYPNRENTNGEK